MNKSSDSYEEGRSKVGQYYQASSNDCSIQNVFLHKLVTKKRNIKGKAREFNLEVVFRHNYCKNCKN